MIHKLSKFVFWLPGIALFMMAWNAWGAAIFESFYILVLICFASVLISTCWLSILFFFFCIVRNLTWYYHGYKKCFWIIFPFVYSKENGLCLLSNTMTYYSLLFEGLPEDFVSAQSKEYKAERNKTCAICERNAMIVYSVLNILLLGLVAIDYDWVLVLLAIWIQSFVMYILDTPEYKGVYTKYLDYQSDNAVFYVAKAAAYQGILVGELRTELFTQAEQGDNYTRFEFCIYKSLKVQCIHLAVANGVDKELFEYMQRRELVPNGNVLINATGQERLECLKVLADSAVLNDNEEQKDILCRKFAQLDMEFVQNIGITLFDIWRKMLHDEVVEGEVEHKFDQTKQILSDSDIYNRKMYSSYDKAWSQLHTYLAERSCSN